MSKKISKEELHQVEGLDQEQPQYTPEELERMQQSLSLLEDMTKERETTDWKEFLKLNYNVSDQSLEYVTKAEEELKETFENIEGIAAYNQIRLTKIYQEVGITDYHLYGSTGYGYGDAGRDAVEQVYAKYFGGEKALVRPQIVSGTHALACGLLGNLKSGDEMVSLCGTPYDTLLKVIDSLKEEGVEYKEVPTGFGGLPNYEAIEKAISEKTKLVHIQRSKGYEFKMSLPIDEVEMMIQTVKEVNPNVICLVDNCYCEMCDVREPGQVGADLVIGSLIKNPGGTLAPSGGYIVGKEEYVHNAAIRLTAPGLGEEMGATGDFNRLALQGLYQAPVMVKEALKGAYLASYVFDAAGYEVEPAKGEPHADIVQAVKVGSEKAITDFCSGIQSAGAVNSTFTPETQDLPGYANPVVMGGGSFIQGSSSELSADGPIREPYVVYMQGGSAYAQVKLGILLALENLKRD